MDNIKEAFSRVKEDIFYLNNEMTSLKKEINELKESLIDVCELIKNLNKNPVENIQKIDNFKENPQKIIQTQETQNPIYSQYIQTDNTIFKPLNTQNLGISTGNGGVQTDRQTDRQTDKNEEISGKDSIEETLKALNKLDSFKKELRLKFKRLTDQEFKIFSKLFEIEEEFGYADYKIISKQINLSESSIRDYIGKIINKGIPIKKNKLNNKKIQLNIDPQLKQITSLNTIITLRDL